MNNMDIDTIAFASTFGLVSIFLLLYWAPVVIAGLRGHPQTMAIAVLTLLAGWTALGWLIALVWACTAVDRPGMAVYESTPSRAIRPLIRAAY